MYGGETIQKISKRFSQHFGDSSAVSEHCAEVHGGMSHDQWAAGARRILMPEELEELQEEME